MPRYNHLGQTEIHNYIRHNLRPSSTGIIVELKLSPLNDRRLIGIWFRESPFVCKYLTSAKLAIYDNWVLYGLMYGRSDTLNAHDLGPHY